MPQIIYDYFIIIKVMRIAELIPPIIVRRINIYI